MNSLYELGLKHGTDKITHHGYHRFYDFFLKDLKDKNIKMLEIGVYKFNSLDMWLDYFPKGFVYCIEIEQLSKTKGDRFEILKGDQSDKIFLEKINENIKNSLDFIIDDGSHLPIHQLASFNFLFKNSLKEGGTYIIEDIETSYWKTMGGGYKKEKSVVEIFKNIVDDINNEFLNNDNKKIQDKISIEIPKDVRDEIGMVTFCQNAIIIKKKDSSWKDYNNRHYRMYHCIA